MSRKRKTPDDGGDLAKAVGSMPASDSDEGMNRTIYSPLSCQLSLVHAQVTGEDAVKRLH